MLSWSINRRGNNVIFKNLFYAVKTKAEASAEVQASENVTHEMQVLRPDELRDVVGGPEIKNNNTWSASPSLLDGVKPTLPGAWPRCCNDWLTQRKQHDFSEPVPRWRG